MKAKGLLIGLGLLACAWAMPSMAANGSKSKFGITVQTCQFDMDDDDFCSDAMMKKFAHVMQSRSANFVQNKLLYIYQGKYFYRMVVMDQQRKTVQPFRWGFKPAERAVNAQGEKLVFEFDRQSPQFCVYGNIEAYRDSYSYEDGKPFCFAYTGTGNDAGFERFKF